MLNAQLVLAQAAADNSPDTIWRVLILIGLGLAALGFLALFVGALVSIFRSATDSATKAVWALIVVMAPVLGCLLWFVFGRSSARGPGNGADQQQPIEHDPATA
ncbi:PLD nuclease N-terminal domain-containing protein [Saccharopolyspora sp. NFXS83]|uniref:PLD nuclease N-terminal domain-containing protein n=1 Tax=Saccharopolyspora sp. NFXS83 TaxID=2993560 RepID=UPI00224B97BB|nr:PLD nuclease N-terminal domain-containing protein [Saccharopolyspora sp. NFXS83]MCX2733799.1 PLD nuclease N-terminal domain-containing protein [Saccharopolyspora sp. NFXS83]